MGVLKSAAMGYGEQCAVMNFGMTTMLEYFAASWAFLSTVRSIHIMLLILCVHAGEMGNMHNNYQ